MAGFQFLRRDSFTSGEVAGENRCWMEALKMDSDSVARDFNRCIGCGICCYICPTDAMKLVYRETGVVG